MFIDISSIKEQNGAKVERTGQCDYGVWQEKMTPVVESPVGVTATAVNDCGRIKLYLAVKYVLLLECDRCACSLRVSHDEEFIHIVDGTENDEDDIVESDENGRIALDPIVWDDMLMTIPGRILCREDCKGLCLNCGKSLNDGPCGCPEPKTIQFG